MRRLIVATLACSTIASSARADGPRYRLSNGVIDVTTDAGTEQIIIDCKRAYALAQSGAHLFVACGEEGVASYSIEDPATPVLSGRDARAGAFRGADLIE